MWISGLIRFPRAFGVFSGTFRGFQQVSGVLQETSGAFLGFAEIHMCVTGFQVVFFFSVYGDFRESQVRDRGSKEGSRRFSEAF